MLTKVLNATRLYPALMVCRATSQKLTITSSWPYIAIITAHLIWGVNFAVAKLALAEIPPMSLAFMRFVLASFFLLPFLLMEKDKAKVDRKDLPKLFSIGILMVTLNIAFFYSGLTKTDIISASSLTMVIPVLSVITGWWFLREKVYVINVIGIFTGFVGTLLILGLPLFFLGEKISPEHIIGDILIILASVAWVAGAIFSKQMSEKYSTLTITAIIFLVGVITFFIPALGEYIANPEWPSQVTLVGIFGLIFVSLASSVSAYFLFEWGLCKLGVIKADLFQYIEPIIAVLIGIFILSNKFNITILIGAVLIGLGVYWSTIGKSHHKHHKAHRH